MQVALAQVCSLAAPFETDIADYAAARCEYVEIWLGKLETYLESHSPEDVRRLFADHRVTAPVASYQGGLLNDTDARGSETWDHFVRRLEICRQLDIATLVLAADVTDPLTQSLLDQHQASLVRAATLAGEHGVRLALEFQARSAFCNNLQTAVALVEQTASEHLGICLDAFHYFIGPSKPHDLELLQRDNLFHVQLCDLAGQTRELASDSDRILPGDGDFQLASLVEHLHVIEYEGTVSVELMNPRIWHVSPRSFGEIGMTALRKTLGLASMEDQPPGG
ncbi:MAG: sugar phosphate isomerase/epimerase family protein [Pirellulales bacterium]